MPGAMSDWRIEPLPPEGSLDRSRAVLGLRNLFREVFGVDRSDRHWAWKYFEAPRSRGLTLVAIRGDDWSQPIGQIGALVLPGVFNGQPLVTTHGFDLMVHPRVRGGLQHDGVYPSLMRRWARAIWELEPEETRRPSIWAYGFPGLVPSRLAVRMGLYRRLYRVLSYHTDWSGASPPSSWTCRVVPVGWNEAAWMNRQWARYGGMDNRPRTLKDARYMQWRYARCPDADYRLWAVKRHRLRDKGWLVTRCAMAQTPSLGASAPLEHQVIDALVPPTWAAGQAWGTILNALAMASGQPRWMSWAATGHACERKEPTLIEAAEFRTGHLVGGPTSVWEDLSGRGRVDLTGGHPVKGVGPLFHPGDTDVF